MLTINCCSPSTYPAAYSHTYGYADGHSISDANSDHHADADCHADPGDNDHSLTASPATLNFKNLDATISGKTKKLTSITRAQPQRRLGKIAAPASFAISGEPARI